jgi:hypothetical protein
MPTETPLMMGTTLKSNNQPAVRKQCFFLVCMLLYFAAHLYLINADTPVNFGAVTFDGGAYCDEGYKTLDARNWILYGSIKWTDTDEYPGWLNDSPLTVWLNYLAFKYFGVSLFSARLVSLFFALGSCLLFYRLLTREYGYLPALYPGSRSNSPVLRFPYAGTNVSLYEFKIKN